MSYIIARSASKDKESGRIRVSGRDNNVSPANWDTFYVGDVRRFAELLFDGDIQFQNSAKCKLKKAYDFANRRAGVMEYRVPYTQAYREMDCREDGFADFIAAFRSKWIDFFELWVLTYM